ncbi:MAG: DUF5333 domain-containing protein [Silicimonas sp.]|nr:DUF5333 domain-containing protein [Silicimonas sp.]
MKKPIVALLLMTLAAPAQALVPLHENPTVLQRFYSVGLADELRKNCDHIDARLIRAYRYIKSIESYARKAGYSEAQIDQFIDNKKEKERLRARIRADLARRGASPKTPEGYCTVGREEIAKGSAAGRLLRAR